MASDVPMIDFSPLGDLGNVYRQARQQATREQVLSQLGQGAGPMDYGAAAKSLFATGDTEGGLSLARLAQQQYLTSPEYITKAKTAEAEVAQKYAPKTSDFKLPGGDTVTIEKTSDGYSVPAVKGLPPPDPNLPPNVDAKAYKDARSKQLGNIDDKAILEADKNVQAGELVKRSLQRAIDLNDKAYSGPFAEGRGYLGSQFGMPGGVATQELTNVVTNQALDNLRATFGGNPTEGERKILLQVQGAASQAPEVRKIIYENAMKAAESRTEFNKKIADEMRSGQYLLPQAQRRGAQPAPDANAWRTKEVVAAARENPQQTVNDARNAVAKGMPQAEAENRLRQLDIDPRMLTAQPGLASPSQRQ